MKLAARPGALAALERALIARAVGGGSGGSSAPSRLVSTYYDTPDRALAGRGLSLRVRERDGHFVQTVKSGKSGKSGAEAGGSPFARGEWEGTIAAARPDPQAAETGRFLAGGVAGHLIPLFRTEVTRHAIDLSPCAGTRIEAAIDRGFIRAGADGAAERISELELELKSGAATALYDVALELLAVAPLRLERRSKAERGYRLAGGDPAPAGAAHAEPLGLDPMSSGDGALQRIGLACLGQVLANEAAVLAGIGEGIHQLRVSVRRLRAIVSAFGRMLPANQRGWVSQELRWLAGSLREARDLDVFESALLTPAQAALGDNAALDRLTAAAERRRRKACRNAAAAMRSTRYTALMLHLLRWFEGRGWHQGGGSAALRQPIGAVAARVLDRRLRVAKQRSKSFAGQSPRQRHQLRIALKKLRYASELLASLYEADDVKRFTTRLKRLQEDLGDANDVRVGHDIVAELARPRANGGAMADAGKRVLDWHDRRLAKCEPKLRKHLHRFLETEPFWHR